MLPKAKNNVAFNKQQVTLTVNKEKEYYLNNKLIVPADLENAIKRETSSMPDPTIVLRMDAELNIQDLVDILATGTKLKVRVVMATQFTK